MKHIIFLFFAVLLTACGRVIDVNELSFYKDATTSVTEVYRRGKPFKGEAWNINETFRIVADDTLKAIEYYYPEGNLAIRQCNNHIVYYDQARNKIPEEKFSTMNPTFVKTFTTLRDKYVKVKEYGSKSFYVVGGVSEPSQGTEPYK